MSPTEPRILRHGLRTRLLHAANALVVVALLASGLAIGDRLPEDWVEALGGHEPLSAFHEWLGLGFDVAAVLVLLFLARPAAKLLREFGRIGLRDLAWMACFLRHALAPSRHAAPAHDGDLDPAERIVLVILLLAIALLGLTGVYLYFAPPLPRQVFAWVMRTHIAAGWTAIGALAIHVFAGLGLLPTHRGLLNAMFGNGTLPLAAARRLWPAWVDRQSHGPGRPTAP